MTGAPQTSAEVQAYIARRGWADALERIADAAPPHPDGGVEILRATGFPGAQKDGSVKQAPASEREAS